MMIFKKLYKIKLIELQRIGRININKIFATMLFIDFYLFTIKVFMHLNIKNLNNYIKHINRKKISI